MDQKIEIVVLALATVSGGESKEFVSEKKLGRNLIKYIDAFGNSIFTCFLTLYRFRWANETEKGKKLIGI